MTLTSILTRLRIRNVADDADLLVVTSDPSGSNPYLADRPVRADGQSVDPLTGKVGVGDYVIAVIDAPGETTEEGVVWREDFGDYADTAALLAVWSAENTAGITLTVTLDTAHVYTSSKGVKFVMNGVCSAGVSHIERTVTGLTPGATYNIFWWVWDDGGLFGIPDDVWTLRGPEAVVANGSGEVTVQNTVTHTGGENHVNDTFWMGDIYLTGVQSTTGRIVTSILADTDGRLQVLGHRAHYEENVNGAGWTTLVDGFLTDATLTDGLVWDLHVGEADRIENTTTLFQELDRDLAEPSCVLGGPVVGGFAGFKDYGAPRFKVVSVDAADFVVLRYVSGPLPPTWGGQTGLLGPLGNQTELARRIINGVAVPLAIPSQDYVPEGRLWVYPDIGVELYEDGVQVTEAGTQTGTAGVFTPISRDVGGSLAQSLLDHFGTDGVGRSLADDPGITFAVDWATSQPSVGDQFTVLMYVRRCSELAPFHLSGHPVEIAAAIFTHLGIAYDATSAGNTITALGAGLWVDLRITAPTKASTVLQDWLYGPFGFAARVGIDGEREFYPTRYRTTSDPAETIAATDIREVLDPVWSVSESSICNRVIWKQDKYRGYPAPREEDSNDVFQKRPADGIDHARYTVNRDSAEDAALIAAGTVRARATTYDIPGQVGSGGAGGLTFDTEAFVDGVAAQIFAVFGRGCPEHKLACLRGVDAKLGDYAIVNLDHVPVAASGQLPTMRRGGQKVIQVVQRTEQPNGPNLTVWDAGPLVSTLPIPLVPTLSIAASAAQPKSIARVTVTNIAALVLTGYLVRIEYGIAGSEPTAWQTLGFLDPDTDTFLDTPRLDAGAHVWARARLERSVGGLQQLGPYGTSVDVDLADLSPPTGLSGAAFNVSTVDLEWTNGEASVPVVVEFKTQAESTWTRAVKLPAGSAFFRLTLPTASTTFDIRVYHEEDAPYDGESTAASTTFAVTGTLPTLSAPTNPIGSGAIGSFTLTVTSTEPSSLFSPATIEFEVAVETGIGAGTFGSFSTYDTAIPMFTGQQVSGTGGAPNDGLLRRLRAKTTKPGYLDSAYCATVDVDPWGDVAPPPGTGGAPNDASYVVLGTHTDLTSERVLTPGHALDLTDAGAGSTVTLDVDLSEAELGELGDVSATAPDDGDVLTWVDGSSEWQPVAPGAGSGATVTVDTFANRPGSPAEGDIFYPTDGIGPQIYNGTKWLTFFRNRLVTPPVNGDFSTVNANGLTITAEFDTVRFTGSATSSGQVTGRFKAAPSTPYIITQAWRISFPRGNVTNTWRAGLAAFRQSGTTELATVGVVRRVAVPFEYRFEVVNWDSPSVANAVVFNSGDDNVFGGIGTDMFLQIEDDGSDRFYRWSVDGVYWHEEYTIGRTSFLTADEVGFAVVVGNNTTPWHGRLIGWDES